MAKNKQSQNQIGYTDWLQNSLVRTSRSHFLLLAAYAAIIIVFDAWHILTPEIVMKRWVAAGLLLAISVIIWYLAHNRANDVPTCKRLAFALIFADILFAAYNVYIQRGMASRAVMLFAIPICVSAVLLSRAAIYATTALSAAAYTIAAVLYFTWNFNEGYKTELYGEVGFYCAVFFVLAGLLTALVRFGGDTNDR